MKYPRKIRKIHEEIEALEVQGATNVAIATLKGIQVALKSRLSRNGNLLENMTKVGNYLAYARPNEPLAQNGVLYIRHFYKENGGGTLNRKEEKNLINGLCEEFLEKVSNAKHDIDELNASKLTYLDHILTHCHSSTAVRLIKGIAQGDKDFTAVCTETRPRYQGRKTAAELLNAGIDTTFIADSAAEAFVVGRGNQTVSAVFIGCDAITMQGYCINKIGSWGIAMSAYQSSKPLYVVTPLLKIDPDTEHHEIGIEIREDKELWENAPEGLKMYNPAFEVVDSGLITGFVTEYGIVEPKDISALVKERYPWLFIN